MTAGAARADFVDALRSRNRAGINRNARRMLDERVPLRGEWFSVAGVLVATGEVSLAVAAAERGAEEGGSTPAVRFQLANVLAGVGRHEEAIELVSDIAPQELGPAERDHFLGTCKLELGDFEGAREAFRRVVTNWPTAGPAWLSLSALPAEDDERLLEQLNAAAGAMQRARPGDVAQWHYARGNVLDRLEQTEEAFAAFEAGAELVRSARQYDLKADCNQAEAVTDGFGSDAIASISGHVGIPTGRPMFVIGLPRSGTTLVEQILVSHSDVAGGGELPFGSILEREIRGNSLGRLESYVTTNGADELARLYLHLGDERFGVQKRFVDKSVDNSRLLGILASVLPEAPIIWMRRDPLDCAWSCFRTFFSEGVEWSWSLRDIAAHFRAEDRLYQHWRDMLGDRLLTVSYEELASDPEPQISRILSHVGLDAEAAPAAAHETTRPVMTASVAQVRKPIYRSSIGSAARYRAHLQPFLEAYAATAAVD